MPPAPAPDVIGPKIGAIAGLVTGAKAIANGLSQAAGGLVTLGFWQPNIVKVDPVKDIGYDGAAIPGRIAAEIGTTVGTAGLSQVKNAARVARAGVALSGLDTAGNVVAGVQGANDAAKNGLNVRNGAMMLGGGLAGAAVAKKVGDKLLDVAPNVVPKASTVNGIKAAGKFDDTVGSLAEARAAIKKAFPDAVELPSAIAGQPYPSPPPGVKQWFQVHPPEPGVGNNLPHIKYADWTTGKKGTGGSWGHIFFGE